MAWERGGSLLVSMGHGPNAGRPGEKRSAGAQAAQRVASLAPTALPQIGPDTEQVHDVHDLIAVYIRFGRVDAAALLAEICANGQ